MTQQTEPDSSMDKIGQKEGSVKGGNIVLSYTTISPSVNKEKYFTLLPYLKEESVHKTLPKW